MRRRRGWLVLAALVALAAAAPAVWADDDDDYHAVTVINTYGVTPFIYGGSSYVPLRSASDFLGAALLWDSVRDRAVITYNGRELGLVIGSTTAYYMGQPVVLRQPPIIVNGHVLVPASAFGQYLDVPLRWESAHDRVLMRGRPGWGYYQVVPYPPPYAVPVVQGYLVPGPFVYQGVTYLPLRDVTDVIGAALLWDHLRNRATVVFGGDRLALVIGSPNVYVGTQVIAMPAPPIIVGGQVFVPEPFFTRHLKVKVEREHGALKVRGSRGMRSWRVSSSPPGRVFGAQRRGHMFRNARQGGPRPSAAPRTSERGREASAHGRNAERRHGPQGKAKSKDKDDD